MVERIKKGWNKKGVRFLGEHVVSIVIGVLVFVIVATFIYQGVLWWNASNELEKAEEALEGIVQKVNLVNKENVEGKIVVFPPESWYLRGFPDYDFPVGECFKAKDCLCICKDVKCSGVKKCEGFDFDIEVDEEISKAVGGNAAGAAIVRYEGLKLDSSESIVVFKDSVVKLRRSEDG